MTVDQLPEDCINILGRLHRDRINTMVLDLINTGLQYPGKIGLSEQIQKATDDLRSYLFKHVYVDSEAKREEIKATNLIQSLFSYFMENPGHLPGEHRAWINEMGVERVVVDYIAGMTDRYAIARFKKLFVPQGFPVV